MDVHHHMWEFTLLSTLSDQFHRLDSATSANRTPIYRIRDSELTSINPNDSIYPSDFDISEKLDIFK